MPDNIELFRQIIERGFNHGDLSVADEICADEFAEHQYLLPQNLPGPEILKIEIRSARDEIQGLNLSIEDIVAEEDKVWARMVARGTDPRSGRAVSIDVMEVWRFRGGRMVEHWGFRIDSLYSISSVTCPSLRHDLAGLEDGAPNFAVTAALASPCSPRALTDWKTITEHATEFFRTLLNRPLVFSTSGSPRRSGRLG